MRPTARTWVLVALPIGGVVLAAVFQALDGRNFFAQGEALAAIAFIGFAIVGALILRTEPRHPLGWVYWGAGMTVAASSATDEYARYSVHQDAHLPGTLFAAWFQNWTWFVPIGLVFTLGLLLFPDGRLPSPGWRWVGRTTVVSLALVLLLFALNPEPLDGYPELENPTGVLPPSADGLVVIPFAILVASALASAASILVRFRSADETERLQLKWMVAAVMGTVVVNVTIPAVGAELSEFATDLIFSAMTLLIPAACGVAILKHRLYEIDIIINRTLVYGGLTAVLGAAYLLLVVALQAVLGVFGSGNNLAVAASTLAVAALFTPARRKMQGFIDRRFYRRKYDAEQTLASFSAHLRDEVNLGALSDELVSVVARTMQPRQVSLWLRGSSQPH